jgi:hypothetical protein
MSDIAGGTVIDSNTGFTIGDVFERTFSILGRNFVPFFLLSAVATLPYLAFYWIQSAAPLAPTRPGAAMALPFIIGFVLKMFTQAVILHAAFQDLRGRPISINDSFRVGFARFLPIVGLIILEGLGIVLGSILLVVPGIILMLMWYLALPACVVEQLGPVKSLSRSAELTKGHRWKILGLILVVGIAGGIVAGVLPLLTKMILGRIGFVVVQYLVQALIAVVNGIIVVVLYRNLRVAKEGLDTEQIAAVFD